MSGLWTPDGDRPVPSDPERPPSARGGDPDGPIDEQALAAELMAAEQQLLAAPIEDVIANHCYGLFQLAALHLGQQPPNIPQARLAIDALGALVDGLGDRLGDNTETLVDGLAQIRLAFVQIAAAVGSPNGVEAEGAEGP